MRLRMGGAHRAVVVAMLLLPVPVLSCMGDLNADGTVDVAEIVDMVSCALGSAPASCGRIEVDELVLAVNNCLFGCELDAVWMEIVTCRQCEGCVGTVIDYLLGIIALSDETIAGLVPAGVQVLGSRIEAVEAACAACGCPEPGTPIFHVLVARSDVQRLLEAGWSVER